MYYIYILTLPLTSKLFYSLPWFRADRTDFFLLFLKLHEQDLELKTAWL
jgi:hypothetical protein